MIRFRDGKLGALGGVPRGEISDERAVVDDVPGQPLILRRVVAFETASQNRDRPSLACQRPLWAAAWICPGKTADDGDSRRARLAADFFRGVSAINGGEARSDNRRAGVLPSGQRTLHIEKRRIVVDIQKVPRVDRILAGRR